MIVLKRANPFTFAGHMVGKLVTDIHTKLRRYCSRRVIELGLVPASFDHEFKFGSTYTTTDNRKSVSKMKSILLKYIIKLVPFTAFASDEFIQIHEKDSLIVNVFTSTPLTVLDPEALTELRQHYGVVSHYALAGNRGASEMYASFLPKNKWCYRYCKYLNYIFRKNGVPIVAVPVAGISFNVGEYQRVRNLNSSSREEAVIPYSYFTKVRFSFGWWQYQNSTYIEPTNTTDVIPDEVYADHDGWISIPTGGGYESLDNPMKARFNIAKLFHFLGEGLRIFTTLSRKASYGSAAFSFKSN